MAEEIEVPLPAQLSFEIEEAAESAAPTFDVTIVALARSKCMIGYRSTFIVERRSRSRRSLPVTRLPTGASTQPCIVE